MILKHVDLIAIGVLLFAFACYTNVRKAVRFEISSHRAAIIHRRYGPVIVIPNAPHIPLTRD